MSDQQATDMAELIALPAFRRFLFRSIQSAGLLSHSGFGADGFDGRDLAFAEGRKSLGFDLLRDAEAGLPAPFQHPFYLMTWLNVLREEAQTPKPESKRGRRNDRYDDGSGDDDGSGG